MTVDEGLEFFSSLPRIARKLQTLQDVGLGYIKIGQPATTLSGGEAQRVKLATELSRRSTGRTIYILDEPTTGLHIADVHKLIEVLQKLVDGGQHRCRHRAQSGPDQDGGLYHRPGAGGRRRRRRSHRMRDAGAGGGEPAFLHRPVSAADAARLRGKVNRKKQGGSSAKSFHGAAACFFRLRKPVLFFFWGVPPPSAAGAPAPLRRPGKHRPWRRKGQAKVCDPRPQ